MKAKITTFIFYIGFFVQSNFAQLDSIPPSVMCHNRPTGWIFFNTNTANVGDLFTVHKSCFFTQPDDSMELIKTWQDNMINFDHYRYQQFYKGIEVEGCEFIEHANSNGKLVYANGKICSGIYTKYSSKFMTEETAFANLISHFPDHLFSWESTEWESEIQQETGDVNATTKPQGELVFALEHVANIQYDMNPEDFRLAWRFDVVCLNPDFNKTVYVDAITGQVFREYDKRHYDGPANIAGHGVQTIDTKERGFPHNDFVLDAQGGGHNIHTKYDNGVVVTTAWSLLSEIDDSDDDWGTSEQLGTAPHWMVMKAWDYFTIVHGRQGMHNNNNLRVRADHIIQGALYEESLGFDIIKVGYLDGGIYSADLAILAHEFSHGVDEHEGKLLYGNESGALDESFADIFGFLTYRWVTGNVVWTIGVPASLPREKRSLQNPNSLGFHYDSDGATPVPALTEAPGQPDTYGGDYFFDFNSGQDAGGVHVNSGIMNHWFYMLSMGEGGTNDLGNNYNVSPIGIDDAAIITYYNFTNNMTKHSQYEDAMEGSVEAALLLFGECSFEHIQTQNAWYGAGLGTGSACFGASVEESTLNFSIYPNPAQDVIAVKFTEQGENIIEVYNVNGQLMAQFNNITSGTFVIDISNYAAGTYLIKVLGTSNSTTKFIKQ